MEVSTIQMIVNILGAFAFGKLCFWVEGLIEGSGKRG